MRKRLMDYGVHIGRFPRGKRNLISDVPGVKVGNCTLISDTPHVYRTGITAILPHEGCIYNDRVVASSFVLNGYGKSTGLVQVEELGLIETPILITSTLNVGKVWDGLISYVLGHVPDAKSINPVVMECNDGRVNEAEYRPLGEKEVFLAIEGASEDFSLGNVGAGTGMVTFGFKGGLGSASRIVDSYTVGALVVSNFGRKEDLLGVVEGQAEIGSIIVVIATDAPLTARQLKRIARRGALGIAKAGGYATHGSGDIVLAFSTAHRIPRKAEAPIDIKVIPDDTKLFQKLLDASVEVVWEAIYDALLASEDMVGRDGKVWKAVDPDVILKKVRCI